LIPIHGFFKSENRAQGGATAYNYGGFLNFFRFIKGFFLSLVLTNIETEAKKLKRDKNTQLNPDDLCIIFAGANDLVTLGYCNRKGAERAVQGIAKTIEILTTPQEKEDSNYAKNVLVFTLPDFSKTPRFSKKTEKEREQAEEACNTFNEQLRNLVKNYQEKEGKSRRDVKIFDTAAVFKEIDENPEAYGFTSGCAVYYLDKNQDKECISTTVTSGNAIVIKEVNQNNQDGLELFCYYVKNGKLVEHGEGSMRLPSITTFNLDRVEDKKALTKKLDGHPLKDGISQLVGSEDKHDAWTTCMVQSAVKAYEEKLNEKIQLADIYASVLFAIKEHFPNQQDLFWDDLHPSVMVHFLLATMFEPFFQNNYEIKPPRVWTDDMAIHQKITPEIKLPPKSAEELVELPSSISLRGRG